MIEDLGVGLAQKAVELLYEQIQNLRYNNAQLKLLIGDADKMLQLLVKSKDVSAYIESKGQIKSDNTDLLKTHIASFRVWIDKVQELIGKLSAKGAKGWFKRFVKAGCYKNDLRELHDQLLKINSQINVALGLMAAESNEMQRRMLAAQTQDSLVIAADIKTVLGNQDDNQEEVKKLFETELASLESLFTDANVNILRKLDTTIAEVFKIDSLDKDIKGLDGSIVGLEGLTKNVIGLLGTVLDKLEHKEAPPASKRKKKKVVVVQKGGKAKKAVYAEMMVENKDELKYREGMSEEEFDRMTKLHNERTSAIQGKTSQMLDSIVDAQLKLEEGLNKLYSDFETEVVVVEEGAEVSDAYAVEQALVNASKTEVVPRYEKVLGDSRSGHTDVDSLPKNKVPLSGTTSVSQEQQSSSSTEGSATSHFPS